MALLYAGLHLPNKPEEFITLEHIDLDKNVKDLKEEIGGKYQFDAENLELIYNGCTLKNDTKLNEYLKPESTIHVFQKTKKYKPYVPSEDATKSDAVDAAQALFYNIKNNQINVCDRLSVLQKVLAEYPEFRRNPAALALIRDSVLFNTLHEQEVIKKVAENYPIIVEASSFIVSTVLKEKARSSSASKFEPATDSTNSSEEENSVGSNERSSRDEGSSSRNQSETARIRNISRQQLQEALAQIGFGSANSLSNIAQRNTETSTGGSTLENTSSSGTGSNFATGFVRNQLQRALDDLLQPSSDSSLMDIEQQNQSDNSAAADNNDIPVVYRGHAYASQLRTMQQMGFLNNEENLNYLNLTNGDIEQAIGLLMAATM